MIITKYKVEKWHDKVHTVICVSETAKTVKLQNGWKENKASQYHRYFDTWEEARSHLCRRLVDSIERAESKLDRERGVLAQVKAMQPPPED